MVDALFIEIYLQVYVKVAEAAMVDALLIKLYPQVQVMVKSAMVCQAMKDTLLIKFYLHAGPSDGGVGHGVPSHKGHLTHQILSPCRSKSWWSRPWCAKP
jgi:hypothetical protein